MNIPVDIVATLIAVGLTAAIASHRHLTKRMSRMERSVLTIIVMLRDRGYRVPDKSDTDLFLKSNNLFES